LNGTKLPALGAAARTRGKKNCKIKAKQLSVTAGISRARFYCRLYPGIIKSVHLVEFLKALHATIGRKLLIKWDGLRAHRSRLVRVFVGFTRGAIQFGFLPAYAPELNPVEYIWGHLKHHALAAFCACDLGHLQAAARRSTTALHAAPHHAYPGLLAAARVALMNVNHLGNTR
jgi:transposase